MIIGRTLTVQELMADFDAVFVANGAGLPMFLNIPGENLKGVYSANEYLTRVNLMGAYMNYDGVTPIARGKRVLVFGGGNVAMDAVRTARRLGADQAICAYRRTRAEMPARIEEIVHAEQEGIDFQFLMAPLEILSDAQGWVRAVRMQRMELGEPDDSGRRRPVPIAGSEFEVECDVAVVALGTLSNPLLTNATPAIALNKWGNIVTDEHARHVHAGRLRRRRHRARRRHGHLGDGRRQGGGALDRHVSQGLASRSPRTEAPRRAGHRFGGGRRVASLKWGAFRRL